MTEPTLPDETVIDETLDFYGEVLDWLAGHHTNYAQSHDADLAAHERWTAVWKLSGQSIAHANALVSLLRDGHTGQTWPVIRAVHECNRLLTVVTNSDDDRIASRWLADKEVKQADVRAAEEAYVNKVIEAMETAGLERPGEIGELSRGLYRDMSKAAHHRRSIVDEGVLFDERTMVYGSDPRMAKRFDYVVFGGALVQEVLYLVGDALGVLYGPPFYEEHLKPVLSRFEETLAGLDVFEAAREHGLI